MKMAVDLIYIIVRICTGNSIIEFIFNITSLYLLRYASANTLPQCTRLPTRTVNLFLVSLARLAIYHPKAAQVE